MKYRSCFTTAGKVYFWMIFGCLNLAAFNVQAETVYYSLENVILEDLEQMTGIFSWTYDIDDFENGTGQFISLDIPWHDENDLKITFDIGSSIEITLTNNLHDDGVDIMLVLTQPLTPNTSSLIDTNTAASSYDIGGNGFHKGHFIDGSISPTNTTPTNTTLSMTPGSSDFILSWGPDLPGFVLQETPSLSSNWVDSASGSTNPVVIPVTAPTMFYRLKKP